MSFRCQVFRTTASPRPEDVELRLPTALTAGSLPIELTAELPARIEPNGELLLQVYPGRHELRVKALYPRPPERLAAPRHAPPGPAQEIWVFVPHTEHRQVEVKGGTSVDPQRTNLPGEWHWSSRKWPGCRNPECKLRPAWRD